MSFFNRYIIPLAFIVLATFSAIAFKWVEMVMYTSVGSAFFLLNLLTSGIITNNKKLWNIVTWVLILGALFLFIAVLRMDAYGL